MIKDICKDIGISYNRFHYLRYVRKFSIEEIILLKETKNRRINHKWEDHKGNVFPTLRSMAKHYGLNTETLRHRLYAGYSIDKALNE